MTTQRNPKNGSLVWEDDASPEARFRRVQQVSPRSGRNLPGMPLEMMDPDDDDPPRQRRRQFDQPAGPWWRPSSTWGRVLLGTGALVILGGFATAFFLLKTSLERDGRFRIAGIDNIHANGLNEVSRADILPVFGEDICKNIFFVHLGERRKELEQIPWIEHATVMRLLPDQLRVSIVERTPVAFVRQGQQIGLVDANGVLLSMPAATMTKHHYSFPVVSGIDARDPLPSRRARMAVYQRLLGDLDSTGQHLSQQVSEIDLTDPEDARVLMPEQGTDILAHFGDDQFLARYQRYKSHIAEWRRQYPNLSAVDLRYDTQVVLQMAPGKGGSQTAVDGGTDPATSPAQAEKVAAKPSPAVKAEKANSGSPAPVHARPRPKPQAKAQPTRAQLIAARSKAIAARDRKKRDEAKHNGSDQHLKSSQHAANSYAAGTVSTR